MTKESTDVPDKVPLNIVEEEANVIAPDQVFLFFVFFNAP